MIELKEKSNCCGCTACLSICPRNAITMSCDEEGFMYPVIDNSICIKCGLCKKVCPIEYRKTGAKLNEVLSVYAARSKNIDWKKKWSSGGIFGLLAEYVISHNGVVFGACYGQNMTVKHTFVSSLEECEKIYGSKYVQSDIRGSYVNVKKILDQGKFVLFSGTPCQVEGLKLFLQKKYEKLVTVDIGCHAVPSPLVFADYINYLNKRFKKTVTYMNMREKERVGWNSSESYSVIFSDGSRIIDPSSKIRWASLFFSRTIDRPSCHACKFTNVNRPGDFTLADFWDRKKTHPELASSDGTSSIFINTEKGQKIFDAIKTKMDCWSISLDDAMQQCFQEPTWVSPRKKAFWQCYKKSGLEKAYFHFIKPSLLIRIMNKLKKLVK